MKSNSKAFTLIELLAVIVILAIIALIATPIILDIIEDSKKSIKLNSANHYLDAIGYALSIRLLENNNIQDNEYTIMSNGNVCLGTIENNVCSDELVVEVKGEKPTDGVIRIENFGVSDVNLKYEDKYIVNDNTGNLVYGFKMYANGEAVYYNVTTGKECLAREAISTIGTKSGCMKFYAFNDKGTNESVNLILDHNTTNFSNWHLYKAGNTYGPAAVTNFGDCVLADLYMDTKDWVGTITPKDYIMNQSNQLSRANYTIEYSKIPSWEIQVSQGQQFIPSEPYKARLITAQEIAQITGADKALNWNEASANNGFYLDGSYSSDNSWHTQIASQSNPSKYYWLFERTAFECINFGCVNNLELEPLEETYGYWTSSSFSGNERQAWSINLNGSLSSTNVNMSISADGGMDIELYENIRGVRPVIEVLKSKLS